MMSLVQTVGIQRVFQYRSTFVHRQRSGRPASCLPPVLFEEISGEHTIPIELALAPVLTATQGMPKARGRGGCQASDYRR